MTFTVCSTPMTELSRETDGERYCFTCRKRRQFEYVITTTSEPSYYDPNHRVECGICHTTDGDCFPGTSREWTESYD